MAQKRFNSKTIVYIAMMSALGIAISVITINSVHFGITQISLDLSHIGTFLVAIPGGPILGAIAGAIGGIYPGIYFGYLGSNPLYLAGLLGLPAGKALTGINAGYIQKKLKRPLFSVTIGYTPECLFTIGLFVFIIPLVTGMPSDIALIVALGIVAKAWIEILFMGFVMETVFLSRGIVSLLRTIFPKWDYTPLTDL